MVAAEGHRQAEEQLAEVVVRYPLEEGEECYPLMVAEEEQCRLYLRPFLQMV